ncbi:G5 domain-containing protein [Actinoplanes sp. N902-109]|uniref:G5 domain-containing protein n=1 Tax=Actinoplanes sp. (strain N902-109) TaxID=649831 RepID=UPI000329671B|nr:G5 domain-containing protein [Actinoplanes sp. N902-109]AGL20922.1 G5 domain-containing protein [Actinoplanes sp. N902-109]
MLNQTSSDYWQHLLQLPPKSFWARLPFGVRMTTAGLGVLALLAGGAGGIAALIRTEQSHSAAAPAAVVEVPPQPSAPAPASSAPAAVQAAKSVPNRQADREADRTATRRPRSTAPAAAPATVARAAAGGPVVHLGRVSETQTIPFRTRLVRDPSMPRGSKRIRTTGVPGERVLHYEVTYAAGRVTHRRLLGSAVTRRPRHRVIAFGSGHGPERPGDNHDGPREDHGDHGDHHDDHNDHDDSHDHHHDDSDRPTRRAALCGDETRPEPEKLLDERPGLLSSDRLDALDLTLPCAVNAAPAAGAGAHNQAP